MNLKIRQLLEEETLTVSEAARYTGENYQTIFRKARRGELEYVKKGNQYLFYKRDLINKEADGQADLQKGEGPEIS